MSLDGKSIIVTGGGTGIGRAAAFACAAAGARVAIADIGVEAGSRTAAEICDNGGQAIFIKTDVAQENEVSALIETTVRVFGRLDGAFNNAGLSQTNLRLHELSAEQWRRVQEVNYDGVFYCMKHQIRTMLNSGGGSIVNVASSLGRVAVPRASEYCGSKGGVIALTKGAAVDYGDSRIRVNVVLPGVTLTPMVQALSTDQKFAGLLPRLKERHPLGRLGQPEEIASAAVWLLSDQSSFVTGAEIPVDGGYLAM